MSIPEVDLAALKKIGTIQQRQKEFFVLRLRLVGGDITSELMEKVTAIAKEYGRGELHLSTRQGIEIPFVHYSKAEAARQAIEAAGLKMGACGPRFRIIIACPGDTICRWGIIDTKTIAKELDEKYFGTETPHKFKLAVTGCPHNCAKSTENDIGIMGALLPGWKDELCIDCKLCVNVCPTQAITREVSADQKRKYVLHEDKCINCNICTSACPVDSWVPVKSGYNLTIGGTMGKIPRFGTVLKKLIKDKDELYALIDKALRYYQKNGRKKERFGHMIDRLGIEKVNQEIINGD
ncbi:MAG: 4Fe-4S dicluster-binding protein [Candidatus Margulisiibacteriota bacterium]